MDESRLGLLHKATISYDYLHTNSTTHEFIFGAIAELVDNSADANAKNLTIDVVDADGDPKMSILDDGDGMSREEAISIMTFGHSWKKMEQGLIGKYGNGLKSGAMRLAKDFIIFTRRNDICTCVMLSRTFHEESNVKDVLLPSPSFDATNRHMFSDNPERHHYEMELIYRHSPYHDQDSLFEQFDKIGQNGTLIVLYNLRRIESGQFELDFTSQPDDIRIANYEIQREEERNSLRAYLSVLYLNPRMKIYLRSVKVATVRILNTLLQPYRYKFLARNLKEAATNAYEQCVKNTKEAKDLLSRAKSDLGEFTNSLSKKHQSYAEKNTRTQQRLLNIRVTECEEKVKLCEEREQQAKKAKTSPPPLNFFFGLNIHHRNRYGCMFYNNGRLIDMYVKPQVQKEKNDILMKLLGVVGIVDIPYSVLEPTHNKQSFANKREFQYILKHMGEEMETYWQEINIGKYQDGSIRGYWKQFGYNETSWFSTCSNSLDDQRKRYQRTGYALQCDRCLKWRTLSFQSSFLENGIPIKWICSEHPNSKLASCSIPEDEPKAKEGRARVKTQEVKKDPISYITKTNPPIRKSTDAPPPSWNTTAKDESVMSKILGDQIAREQNGGRLPPRRSSTNAAASSPTPATLPRAAKAKPTIVDDDDDDDVYVEKPRKRTIPSVMPKVPARKSMKLSSSESEEEEEEDDYDEDFEDSRKSSQPRRSARDKPPARVERNSSGVPPMKRPKTSTRVVQDDEEFIIEPISSRKPKTKAEMRRLLNEEPAMAKRDSSNEKDNLIKDESSVHTSNGHGDNNLKLKQITEELEAMKSKNDSLEKELNKMKAESQSKSTKLEKDLETWKAVSHSFVNYFLKKGLKHAQRFQPVTDDKVSEMDVQNFMDNIWNEAVRDPKRADLDSSALLRKIKVTYAQPDELVSDLFKVMSWAFENQEDNIVREGQEFEKLREMAGLL